jgi:hypothetical protein
LIAGQIRQHGVVARPHLPQEQAIHDLGRLDESCDHAPIGIRQRREIRGHVGRREPSGHLLQRRRIGHTGLLGANEDGRRARQQPRCRKHRFQRLCFH